MSFKLHETFRMNPDDGTPDKEEEPTQERPDDEVDHKQDGNNAFKKGSYDEAIEHYGKAIAHDAKQASLYSNRAACYAQKGEYEKALTDAKECIQIDPKFVKAYARKGHALFYLKRFAESEEAYAAGLKVDPDNDACKRGLEEAKEAIEKRRKPPRRKAFNGVRVFAKSIMERVKLMHVLAVIAVGLSMVVGHTVRGLLFPSMVGDVSSVRVQRGFKMLDGIWMSYLEAGASSKTKLLLLHRPSLSAEAEFGAIIPQISMKAAPAGGLKVVAPDRPCHGYSLCPEGGEPYGAFTLYGRILAERPLAQTFAYMTSGRRAARHALEIVQRRRQPAQLLLLRPQMVSPDTKGLTSPLVAAESARWALLGNTSVSTTEPEPLTVGKMPSGCEVMLIYLDGDQEDHALETAFVEAEVSVSIRHLDSLQDGLVSAVSHMFGDRASLDAVEDFESQPQGEGIGKMISALVERFHGATSHLTSMAGAREEEEW